MQLQDRKRRILKAIIENYINTAEPVGSKMLAVSFDQPISSATIRNEMSELEEMGYLEKPHVSAGRIPSYAAYRFYVNELMDRHKVATAELEQMRAQLRSKMQELDNIMVTASKVISEMTNHTSLSMINRKENGKVKKCELITIDGGFTYAVVLVTDTMVKNRMFRLGTPIEPSTAAVLSTAINLALSENTLPHLLQSITQSMGMGQVYELTRMILTFINDVEGEGEVSEVYVNGAARLLENREYQDTERARELLDYVSDKSKLRDLVDIDAPNIVNVKIGPEIEDPSMRDASLVFSTYRIDEHTNGIVGIIAPARMDYASVCSKLAAFAQIMSNISGGIKQINIIGENDDKTRR